MANGLLNMARAAAGALPFIPRGDRLPQRTITVTELPIDAGNVAAYADVTGLRFRDTVPLTYPFALTFPTVMELITGFDFPFSAIGAVHVENVIDQYRPIAVSDTVGVRVHAQNLREHRKGLLVDVVTEVNVGNEPGIRSPRSCTGSAPASPPNPSPSHRPRRSCRRPIPSSGSRRSRSAATRPSVAITTQSTPASSVPGCSGSRPSSRMECSVAQRFWRISRVSCRIRCATR
jgi:hypothetical protein